MARRPRKENNRTVTQFTFHLQYVNFKSGLSHSSDSDRSSVVLQTARMITTLLSRSTLLMALSVHSLCVAPAFAGLGGDAASVLEDRLDRNDSMSLKTLQECDIREIASANGMRIREFLNREGIVFAVAWSGPAPADLRRLLGTHFAAYVSALAELESSGLHHPSNIHTPGLVVQDGGHLRAYAGRAYIPALIPSGIAAADLN